MPTVVDDLDGYFRNFDRTSYLVMFPPREKYEKMFDRNI